MAAPATASAPAAPAASRRWLYGPIPDLFLGCGLLYACVFACFALYGAPLRVGQAAYLFPILLLLVSVPHYGGTLLRVYEERDSRRSYAIFSVWATLAVAAAFVAGIYQPLLGSLLFSLYITWSPWHYTGQNYGLAVMFLRRRGVAVDGALKRLLYASFILSFAIVFLSLHRARGGATDLMVGESVGQIAFLPLGIPTPVADTALIAVVAAYVGVLVGAFGWLLRRATARDLLPVAVLALSQALWFSVPLALRDWRVDAGIDPLRGDVRGYYFYWIALAHSAQYLWVTSYYARASRRWHGHVHYLAKTLMAGAAVWTLPVVVFAPDALGSLSYDAGLALLVSAAVNVHHFILDGAIWKLRSSRIASVLIRSVPEEPGGALEPERRAWLRPAVWATAGFAACVAVFVLWQEYFVFEGALERKDPAAAEAALDRLAWFGRDDWIHRVRLGHSLSEAGEDEAAMEAYRRSLELQESPAAYAALGWLHKKRGDLAQAEELLLSALELAPRHPKLLRHAAEFSLERGELKGAEEYLARLEALEGSDDETVRRLRRAQRRLEQAPIASY